MERKLRLTLTNGSFGRVDRVRSRGMAAVRGRNNKSTERRLRASLVRAGVSGWTVQPRGLNGAPDFVFSLPRVAVFVDGCFWHGCTTCGHYPKTRREFWQAKLDGNKRRDRRTTHRLRRAGFVVLRFWEHELRDDLRRCLSLILTAVDEGSTRGRNNEVRITVEERSPSR